MEGDRPINPLGACLGPFGQNGDRRVGVDGGAGMGDDMKETMPSVPRLIRKIVCRTEVPRVIFEGCASRLSQIV